jgi:branched-chain amino acid aminotransferase
MLAYVNGELVPEEEASVSVFDAGLNFADGVFEGVRVYGGKVFRLAEHIDRLYASAATFELDPGFTKEELRGEILRWLAANDVTDDFHFRPIVTRGRRFPPRMDPRFSSGDATTIIVGGPVGQPGAPVEGGARVVTSTVRRPAPSVLPAHVKSLSYGPALLARLEATRRGADEAIMLDELGLVAEATVANVFAVRDGALLTPVPRACLDGITRRAIMSLGADAGLKVLEVGLTPEVLAAADEVFLTGTSAEVTPVAALDGIELDAPGPVTRTLSAAYHGLTRSEGTPIPAAGRDRVGEVR